MMNSSRARPTDIHHDADGCGRECVELDLAFLEPEQSLINVARVPFGAGDRDVLSGLYPFGGVAAAHNRGDAELACDDGRVAGAAAAIGHDS